MRRLLFTFLLFACAIPASAFGFIRSGRGFIYDPIRIVPFSRTLTDFRNDCPSYMVCSAHYGVGMLQRKNMAVNILSGYYAGIPFHKGAVFCRMENHFLLKYNVKFSIHAGGYHE